jgi:enoyl-CoA hydratase/carnithine racemase
MPALERQDNVFVLNLGDGENRFHPDWVASVNDALDEVEKADGPRALVTAATGKFYSNGLDLDWLFAHADAHRDYIVSVHALLARLLSLPVVTIAALQGHAFAAGAMLSLAHDLRVMRADRGYWCLPEAGINLPFTPGMSALIAGRLAPQTAHEAMITARRFGGHEALAAGIVDRAVAEESVRATAVDLAQAQASKAGDTLRAIKARLYAPALDLLLDKENPLGLARSEILRQPSLGAQVDHDLRAELRLGQREVRRDLLRRQVALRDLQQQLIGLRDCARDRPLDRHIPDRRRDPLDHERETPGRLNQAGLPRGRLGQHPRLAAGGVLIPHRHGQRAALRPGRDRQSRDVRLGQEQLPVADRQSAFSHETEPNRRHRQSS